MLSEEQAKAFESITSDVYSGVQRAHFAEGPGGSGKTFLYNVIFAEIRGKGLGAAAVASSGISSLLLHGRRTAHSTLKLPIGVSDESLCAAQKGSAHSAYLGRLSLIIWDEAPMAHRHLAECLDRSDIRSDERPFGGVAMVFGGDPRQIPPVDRHGRRAKIVSESLKLSPLWIAIKRHQLSRNLRLCQGAGEFASYLIKIGDGDDDIAKGGDTIELPPDFCTDAAEAPDQFAEISRQVPPDLETRYTDDRYMVEGGVLAAKNEDVDRINSAVMSRFDGDPVELRSADIVLREGDEGIWPSEFLNSLDISGLPPHLLRIKIGAHVILLRNLNPDHEMRNGTKAIVRRISQMCVDIELFTGELWFARVYTKAPASIFRYRSPVYFGALPVRHPAVFCGLYD